MIRGTTPTHTITTDIDLSQATVYLTYAQGSEIVCEKTNDDLVFDSSENDGETTYTITAELSQEETLALDSSLQVRIQIRAIFADGKAIASNIMVGTVDDILKDGEIEYES